MSGNVGGYQNIIDIGPYLAQLLEHVTGVRFFEPPCMSHDYRTAAAAAAAVAEILSQNAADESVERSVVTFWLLSMSRPIIVKFDSTILTLTCLKHRPGPHQNIYRLH